MAVLPFLPGGEAGKLLPLIYSCLLYTSLHCCTLTEAPRKASGIFPMQKAALFPFNKEMHSLLRFQHLLDFEIADVYDTKYSLAVGNTTDALLKDQTVAKRRVRNLSLIHI